MSVVWDKPTRARLCRLCGNTTRNATRLCGFCTPDAHEVAERRDEAMAERYDVA